MTNSNKNIVKLNEHHNSFKTDKMKVPATFLMSENLFPKKDTFQQIENIACNDCLFHSIAALPDVMSKPGRKNASGTTIVSKNHLLPQVNDSDPNCGMRVVKTNLTEDNISEQDLDKLFKKLVYKVPTKALVGTKVPYHVIVDLCRGGTQALIDHLDIKTKNELENSQGKGNYFGKIISKQDLFDAVPQLYLHFAQFRLGLIGAAGNHFMDLMKVTEIVEPEISKKFGIKKGQYLFMVHTGSGILGQYTMYTYTAKKREHLSQSIMVNLGQATFKTTKKDVYKTIKKAIEKHMNGDDSLLKYDANGDDGKLYMTARNAASNFGTANRATIIHNISETIKEVLGRDPEMDLLYDLPHISIEKENHFDEDVWVHRNNTSRAYGPAKMQNHPIFKDTGEPVFIPSSMSTEAYIGVGTDTNTDSFFSAPHGTGKGVKTSEKNVPKNREELMKKMKNKGVKLYNAQSSKTIEQDSSQYKDVSSVIKGVEDNGIAKIIAKMKPISVIMY